MTDERKRVMFTLTICGTTEADVDEGELARLELQLKVAGLELAGEDLSAVTVDCDWELCE